MVVFPRHEFLDLIKSVEGIREECCGFLLGRREEEGIKVERFLPTENSSPYAKEKYYLISFQDYKNGEAIADRCGMEILGIYHTHIDHPALLSSTDKRYAFPGYYYLIISLISSKFAEAKVWLLNDSEQFEEKFIVF